MLALHGLKVCVWFWGCPAIILIHFFHFFDLVFFPGPFNIGIDSLLAQLLLEFSTDHFETIYAYFFYMV